MLYYVKNLRFEHFDGILTRNQISQDFDEDAFLKSVRSKLRGRIKQFIFSNPYTIPYIDDEYGTSFFKSKFDYTIEVLFALSDKYSKNEIDGRKECLTFKDCQVLLKSSVFGQFFVKDENKRAYDYSSITLNRFKKKFRVLLEPDTITRLETSTDRYKAKQGIPEGGSRSEDLLRFYMEYIFGVEFKVSYPPWLINPETGKGLELDGYNKELGIAFECDGPDHYDLEWIMSKYFPESKYPIPSLRLKLATDKLNYRLKVDQFKTEECRRRGITLVRVNLKETGWSDFQSVVKGFYESFTGTKSSRRDIDYRIAVRAISARFLNLRWF